MSISTDDHMRRFIDERLKSGQYANAEDVLRAGLVALEQHESYGHFEARELDGLLAEGERGIESVGAVEAKRVLDKISHGKCGSPKGEDSAGRA